KDTRTSASRADEYIRNFLEGESLPSAENELALHQQFLPGITLAEVNKLAKEWFPEQNRLVVVTAPQKAGLVMPDEAKLSAVIKAVPTKELKPYVDTVASATLLETPPAPGAIAKTAVKESVGVTEWELSNGVKVVLKPTTFKADEILFRATSPGGTSLVSDADFVTANAASQVIAAGGLGKFSATDLRKMMAGKVAGANPFIGELEEGLNGSAARKDLETMFQLIYLRFTQPRADAEVFKAMTGQMKTMLANQAAAPQYSFFEAFNLARYQNHPRRRMTNAAMIDEWNLDKSLAFYRDRFADASDFTFVFVGSFDLATIKPLVERYLGALPSLKRKETWKDIGVRLPTGVIEKRVEKGVEPKSQAALVFSGTLEYNATQRVALSAMAEILGTKLLETIREELGGTYSINASPSFQKNPAPEYSVTIQFGCAPERTDDLIQRVLQEVEKLKAEGPTEKQLQVQKEKMMQSYEASTQQNGYWLNQLTGKYQNNEDPAELLGVPEFYKKLDATAIQQAAKKYLNTANLIKVTLFPEKK
ncbi:MAG: insulinase family protein, partial [Acidobacteria bacterium]|nr:insulinase family protein [Acidobacteriota bacterium]